MLAEYVEKCSFIDKTTNVVWVRVIALYQTTILVLQGLRLSYSILSPTDRPILAHDRRQTYPIDRPTPTTLSTTNLLRRLLTTPQTKDRQKTYSPYTNANASNLLGRSTRLGRRQLFDPKTGTVEPLSPWIYLPCKKNVFHRTEAGNCKSARGPSTAALFERPVLTPSFTTSPLLVMPFPRRVLLQTETSPVQEVSTLTNRTSPDATVFCPTRPRPPSTGSTLRSQINFG